jgi:hypothetical protein
MTTVAEISLKVIREAQDVPSGSATGGSTTTLVDASLSTFPDDHFNNGRLWILSGTHAGKVFIITDFVSSTGTVTFATVTGAIVTGVSYAIARAAYPWDQVVSAINRALETTHITATDSTLAGDGETLNFTLPANVYDIKRIELEDSLGERTPAHHWKETSTTIRFDYGYAPDDGDTIHLIYRQPHTYLTDYTSAISNEIELDWLKWKAAEELLWWGVSMYGQQVEYRVEERMNKVLKNLANKHPKRWIEVERRTTE